LFIRNNRSVFRLVPVIFLLFFISFIPVYSGINLSISEWDLGEIEADLSFFDELIIENTGGDPVRISLMSTCGCLLVEPQEIILEPDTSAEVIMNFNSSDDTGDFEKIIIVRTTDPDLSKAFFMVRGFVNRVSSGGEVDEPEVVTGDGDGGINGITEEVGAAEVDLTADLSFYYYYSPTCKECREFLAHRVPELSEKLGKKIIVNGKDIQDPVNYEELLSRLSELGVESEAFPVVIFQKSVIQGEREIGKTLEALLESGGSASPGSNENIPDDGIGLSEENGGSKPPGNGRDLRVFPVLAAGLLDGVNPCAFTTLIFLLTALAVAGRSRREILVIGLFFTLSVYVTYYLVGVGFFGVIRMADSFTIISMVIKWLLVAVLLIFAGLSIFDYVKIRKNKISEIILQLPKGMKKRIHKSVRTYSRSTALAGSSIIMGFLVSIFELGCTGQIYFPTITYMIKTEGAFSGYFMLALYNLAFILPLLLIFYITYRGVSSDKVTAIFQKNLGPVKLFTAVLFIVLAVITTLN